MQLAYAIGVADPVSVLVDTEARGDRRRAVLRVGPGIFPLTPGGIIRYLDLRRPIYRMTASGGHFGRNEPDLPGKKPTAPLNWPKPPAWNQPSRPARAQEKTRRLARQKVRA